VTRRPAAPPYGEPERVAWSIVLTAIEAAMDIDGVQSFDRGRLADLHERAAWHIGMPACAVPVGSADGDAARAAGGVYELARFGVDADTLAVLAYRGGIRRVKDVERSTDDELLGILRIGPKRLAAIRVAVRRYRNRPDVDDGGPPG
jgi:hypothetical protein